MNFVVIAKFDGHEYRGLIEVVGVETKEEALNSLAQLLGQANRTGVSIKLDTGDSLVLPAETAGRAHFLIGTP